MHVLQGVAILRFCSESTNRISALSDCGLHVAQKQKHREDDATALDLLSEANLVFSSHATRSTESGFMRYLFSLASLFSHLASVCQPSFQENGHDTAHLPGEVTEAQATGILVLFEPRSIRWVKGTGC